MNKIEAEKLRISCMHNSKADHDTLLKLLSLLDNAASPAIADESREQEHLLIPLITVAERIEFHDAVYRSLFRHAIAHMVLDQPPDEQETSDVEG
jgi:hypothetical protein